MKSPALVFDSNAMLRKHDLNGTALETTELDIKCCFDWGSFLETFHFMGNTHIQEYDGRLFAQQGCQFTF